MKVSQTDLQLINNSVLYLTGRGSFYGDSFSSGSEFMISVLTVTLTKSFRIIKERLCGREKTRRGICGEAGS